MIQRVLAASIMTSFLLLPAWGCNQKEKAILPSATIPLPEHGPVAGGIRPADPVDKNASKDKVPESSKAPEKSKEKELDPTKATPPK